jgi:hypothetical protein
VQRKTSRDKGKAPPPPIQPPVQPSSSSSAYKPSPPPLPVLIPNLPTPPSSPITPPATPPHSSPVHPNEVEPRDEAEVREETAKMEGTAESKVEAEEEKRPSQEKLHFGDVAVGDTVTVNSQDGTVNNFLVVSPQSERNKLNTSTITINSDLPDPSNSLASNISQVEESARVVEFSLKIVL